MILYRKTQALRVRRKPAPDPPFWCATTISPYSDLRGEPVAIDYVALVAGAADRLDVTVCSDVAGELDRGTLPQGPVLIESTGRAESVFRRGGDAFQWCTGKSIESVLLVSTEGALPEGAPPDAVVGISAWPASRARLDDMCREARERSLTWGVVIPVVVPVTSELDLLEKIADSAARHGARFLTGCAIDLEPAARQSLAQMLALEAEDDRYAMLFHGRVEPLAVATERHIAALAAERDLGDHVVPASHEPHSNWAAATLLMRTATRMMTMELDLDRAGSLARAARAVASLQKPLTRIAESASLSIVGTLDETSAEMLTEWLATGRSSLADSIDELWRMRRA